MSPVADVDLIEKTVAGRPAWLHEASGVMFRLIPAGVFRMGFSDEELTAVDALADDFAWYGECAEPAPRH
jgi:hypothetical protein